jgi:hypothetical protein
MGSSGGMSGAGQSLHRRPSGKSAMSAMPPKAEVNSEHQRLRYSTQTRSNPPQVTVLSTQKFEARFQSAAVAIGERERAAKRADELLGDGQAKPGATGFAIARSLDPIKR